ncbi:M28 family metallopeptidase [Iodobacter fluviatilis]|uniref:Leucyl aminopeptidase n=1 Tax=Iodobacter fluviatilis TaxID=537 RepID=A0A377QAR9_9NEIS|nr:M28 family metallopeptidase [Iodobacter fluviatilis]TCU83688.1 leucyl aminopeptidase [Iodobacter fluviatilis]STQ91805.1 Bacterial leucyl aminopeptidase precursor [Iodobacter fluviatilis]
MKLKVIPLLLCGVLLSAAADAAPKKVWITLGDAAYLQLQKLAPQTIAKESRAILPQVGLLAAERVHLVEVDEQQLAHLSASVHEELHRCGGFMFHASEAAGRQALTPVSSLLAAAHPSYALDNQSVVNALLPQMQDSNIAQTINDLSAFTNRYYTTTHGVNASNWLKTRWQQIAAGRSDITVEQFNHSWAQKSVILTIKGTDNPSEVVVLGGHLDSINGQGTSESTRAPGADDDASGIASMTEVLRVLVAGGYKPRRTLKLMGYAAEEVGLRGSQDIAKSFKAANTNVVGVMQLDMTNYKGSDKDIYLYTDYTDNAQNQFVANLLTTYLPAIKIGYDKCGYACSDHASWSGQGYFASMPFESSFTQDNPYIHTANDTYANSGNQAQHALKFSKMALAFMVELGSDGPVGPGPVDKVENFSGKLAVGQKQSYGPFKVGAGGDFTAVLSGTGDADLYLRKASAPSTTVFDCKSDGPSSTETCALNLSANGDVYLLLNGYSAANYTLKVTYRPQ